MALPKIFQMLFGNDGKGPKLREDILPEIDVGVTSVNGNTGNITPEQTGCLPLAGGTMTGNITMNGNMIYAVNGIEMIPPSGAAYGGHIDFHYGGSGDDYTSRILEDSSGRLSISATNGLNLNGVPVEAVLTASNGTTWFRQWSNGWIEAGGVYDNGSVVNSFSGTVSFPIAYNGRPISLVAQTWRPDNQDLNTFVSLGTVTSTSFGFLVNKQGIGGCRYVSWYACGY